jgi:hypothetical protein
MTQPARERRQELVSFFASTSKPSPLRTSHAATSTPEISSPNGQTAHSIGRACLVPRLALRSSDSPTVGAKIPALTRVVFEYTLDFAEIQRPDNRSHRRNDHGFHSAMLQRFTGRGSGFGSATERRVWKAGSGSRALSEHQQIHGRPNGRRNNQCFSGSNTSRPRKLPPMH